MRAWDGGPFINEVYVYSKPSSGERVGVGTGLSSPKQMSGFDSKEWPWEFSLGHTGFRSDAGLLCSAGRGALGLRAPSQALLRAAVGSVVRLGARPL